MLGCCFCFPQWGWHYTDVIMTTMASQITSLTVVYFYPDADQRKHQSSASLAFVWGIHRDRWIPRAKGQLRGKCFHLMTSSWVRKMYNNGRCHKCNTFCYYRSSDTLKRKLNARHFDEMFVSSCTGNTVQATMNVSSKWQYVCSNIMRTYCNSWPAISQQ